MGRNRLDHDVIMGQFLPNSAVGGFFYMSDSIQRLNVGIPSNTHLAILNLSRYKIRCSIIGEHPTIAPMRIRHLEKSAH